MVGGGPLISKIPKLTFGMRPCTSVYVCVSMSSSTSVSVCLSTMHNMQLYAIHLSTHIAFHVLFCTAGFRIESRLRPTFRRLPQRLTSPWHLFIDIIYYYMYTIYIYIYIHILYSIYISLSICVYIYIYIYIY